MRQLHGMTVGAVRWSSAWAATAAPQPDARLQEAQSQLNEAQRLEDAGRYAEALGHAEQALALRVGVLGERHEEVARCMYLLGMLHFRLGRLAQARQWLQRGLEIRQELLGKDHPDVADLLNGLGILEMAQGQPRQAEPLLLRARAIWETALRRNHPKVATALANLATLYQGQGLYGRAQVLYEHASHIDEEAYGRNDPQVAGLFDNLASLYKAQGAYGRAESLYARGLAIRESALGREHASVADSLNNLALLCMDRGQYERAGPLQERALAVGEAALGANHPGIVHLLNNLANLYKAQGQYVRAGALYERALLLAETALGKDHPDVAVAVTNLAVLLEAQGQYARAQPLYERALRIQEEAFGCNHPDVALTLHNLAALLADQGLHEQAMRLCERAIDLREELLGGAHPLVASSLANLASIYRDQGRHEQAELLYTRALVVQEESLGEDHTEVAETLRNLGQLRLAQGCLAEALPLFARAFASFERRLRREALGFSEARLASFLQMLRAEEARLHSLVRAHPEDADARRLALGAVLLLKGRSIDEMASISRQVLQSQEGEEWSAFDRLRALRTQLAMLSLRGPGALPLADYQQQLKELAEQGDVLEVGLARNSAALRARVALPSLSEIVDRVAARLPRDGALVEFTVYADRPVVPEPGSSPKELLPGEPRYLALMLFPDASTRAVDLGPAEPIDAAAVRLRDALAIRDASFQGMAEELYSRVFRPLAPLLGGRRELFLSPDGQLSLVPFAALHDGQQFLVDAFDISYLTSGNDLLPRSEEAPSSDTVVVLADPDFTAAAEPSPVSHGLASWLKGQGMCEERALSASPAEAAECSWVPLPGTRQEAEAIQRLVPQARLFLGAEASKERLLRLPAPGVLHLATHGFFLEDAAVHPGTRGLCHFGALGDAPRAQLPSDPLLRSGLVLARARPSEPALAGASSPGPESSLATALELTGLNLWGTELVVLSACDTGRGEIKLGQGVYGLRRAFLVAGAETVVLSLWKVNDQTTRELMEAYYRNLLEGQGRASALREAMRALRQTRAHPHDWAPFIAVGRDAPVRALLQPSSRG
ncbi:CHAT domain-containing tetratricopeptide repeat protein [Hyalangium versicolor]|uniref:CHAT domain-containing tetratricopeptide repeat protein n=1 Tax=Hyalangium versicolor TaxID=2861190 RepID=UPI001CCA7683|nr:CHAT domain-containing protein [Hyalangium versicolor]